MGIDFKDWLTITDEQRADVAANSVTIMLDAMQKADGHIPKAASSTLQQQWATWGAMAHARLKSASYQKLITYILLQGVTPAVAASLIRAYIEKGKLPWRS